MLIDSSREHNVSCIVEYLKIYIIFTQVSRLSFGTLVSPCSMTKFKVIYVHTVIKFEWCKVCASVICIFHMRYLGNTRLALNHWLLTSMVVGSLLSLGNMWEALNTAVLFNPNFC